jgi:hypothetical protein
MLKEFCSTMLLPPNFDLHAHTESLIITEVTDSLDYVSFKWFAPTMFLKNFDNL